MSFFIQTNLVANDNPTVNLVWGTTDQSLFIVDHLTINKDEWIAPPVPYACPDYEIFRVFLHPLGVQASGNQGFALLTHSFGRTYWIIPSPSQAEHKLRFAVIDGLPPATPHPCKWEVSMAPNSGTRLYNQLYNQFLEVVSNDNNNKVNFTLNPLATNNGIFWFHWNTGCGPVAPRLPDAVQAVDRLRYIIVTRFGKAIQWSDTAPYFNVATINFNAPNQQFFFRAQGKPYVGGNAFPFTYNMFSVTQPDTMISFQDDCTFGTRTDAGVWEELVIKGQDEAIPDNYARFAIYSNGSSCKLRANSDGNGLSLVYFGNSAQPGDYFSFLPAVGVL
eukprot:GILI01007878.1.p1 GENE.GILI01007878.1~~GILI01007878.1.p1  ORF type:complete len:333 (+),score=41.29 GILI01007878.1:69-1067(+)